MLIVVYREGFIMIEPLCAKLTRKTAADVAASCVNITIPEVGSTVASSSLADTADNGLFCGDFFHRKLRNGDFERDLSLLRSLTNWLREAKFSKYTHKQKYFYKQAN